MLHALVASRLLWHLVHPIYSLKSLNDLRKARVGFVLYLIRALPSRSMITSVVYNKQKTSWATFHVPCKFKLKEWLTYCWDIKVRSTGSTGIAHCVFYMRKFSAIFLETHANQTSIMKWSIQICAFIGMVGSWSTLYNMSCISVKAATIEKTTRHLLQEKVDCIWHLNINH